MRERKYGYLLDIVHVEGCYPDKMTARGGSLFKLSAIAKPLRGSKTSLCLTQPLRRMPAGQQRKAQWTWV